MELYLLRHAPAVDRSAWRKRDADRPLTSEGKHKMQKVAKGMKQLPVRFDAILTSPWRRAYDTAAIVAGHFKSRKKLKVVEDLTSEGNPKRLLWQIARDYGSGDRILLVGHEPYLSGLISVLIGSPVPLGLDFKKGGLCKLTVESLRYGRCAELEWWLPPKLLKRLA